MIVDNVFNIPELPLSLPNMTDADHGILISRTSLLREAAVVEARFWIAWPLILPTELRLCFTAAKALPFTASHTEHGWGLNGWGLVGWQFLLEQVMLSNEGRMLAGSSRCC